MLDQSFGDTDGHLRVVRVRQGFDRRAIDEGLRGTIALSDPVRSLALETATQGIGANSPAEEDMNSLCYLFAYQLAYLMQAGVPEWDSGTTYFIGDIVQSSGTLYSSLTNTNLNNAVTDTTNWSAPVQNGILTTNTLPSSTTVTTGTTLSWPNLTIPNGLTLLVNSGGNFEGLHPTTVASGGTLTINGTSYIL